MEAQLEVPARVGECRKLKLVAISYLALRADGWRHQLLGSIARKTTDTAQLIHHVGALGLELLLVGKPHPRAAAAYPRMRAGRLLA